MDLDTDNDLLQKLSDGQSMDYEQWPGLLARIIPRLEHIVHHDFPIPSVPAPLVPSSQPVPSFTSQTTAGETSSQTSSTTSTHSQNKENDPPSTASIPPGSLPPQSQILLTSITSTLTSLFQTHPPHTIQRLAELTLNPKQHYRTLTSYLHAVDRVVHVTSGAHVFPPPPPPAIPDPSSAAVLSNGTGTSSGGIDPLSVSWGNPANTSAALGLGSDESLGGALLTPITWDSLKNGKGNAHGTHSPLEGEVKTESTEMIEGPNGRGGMETVTVSVNGVSSTRGEAGASSESSSRSGSEVANLRAEGGVTQGELLRQEQRAGVVPVAQVASHHHRGGDTDGMGEEDELPHARGPEEIGMDDVGPQSASNSGPGMAMQGIDVEAAVGRKFSSNSMDGAADEDEDEDKKPTSIRENETEMAEALLPKREADEQLGGHEKRVKEEASGDVDLHLDLADADADGKHEHDDEKDKKVSEQVEGEGENKATD